MSTSCPTFSPSTRPRDFPSQYWAAKLPETKTGLQAAIAVACGSAPLPVHMIARRACPERLERSEGVESACPERLSPAKPSNGVYSGDNPTPSPGV